MFKCIDFLKDWHACTEINGCPYTSMCVAGQAVQALLRSGLEAGNEFTYMIKPTEVRVRSKKPEYITSTRNVPACPLVFFSGPGSTVT